MAFPKARSATGSPNVKLERLEPTNMRERRISPSDFLTSSMPTSTRFRLNYNQQLAQRGLKNSPLPSLPPCLRSNATPRFDFSPDSSRSTSSQSGSSSLDLPKPHPAQATMIA